MKQLKRYMDDLVVTQQDIRDEIIKGGEKMGTSTISMLLNEDRTPEKDTKLKIIGALARIRARRIKEWGKNGDDVPRAPGVWLFEEEDGGGE